MNKEQLLAYLEDRKAKYEEKNYIPTLDLLIEDLKEEIKEIVCGCNESCGKGLEGSDGVSGHIEECSCYECHHLIGKLN